MTDEILGYDEDASLAYIRNYLPQELKDKFSDDDIVYFTDLIFDFFESRGFFDEEVDEEDIVEFDEEELLSYVIKNARRDEVGSFDIEEIRHVVMGELAYYESTGLFED